MAGFCDIKTGKIYGCEKGSYVWWHEKGHLIFNKSERGSFLQLCQQYILLLFFFSGIVAITFINKIAGLLVAIPYLIYLCFELYEEHWCWKYAKENFK